MALSPDPAVPPEKVRPLRRAEYDRIVGLGMFRDEQVELLHGRLVRMSPQGEPQFFSLTRLTKLLVRATTLALVVAAAFAACSSGSRQPQGVVPQPEAGQCIFFDGTWNCGSNGGDFPPCPTSGLEGDPCEAEAGSTCFDCAYQSAGEVCTCTRGDSDIPVWQCIPSETACTQPP